MNIVCPDVIKRLQIVFASGSEPVSGKPCEGDIERATQRELPMFSKKADTCLHYSNLPFISHAAPEQTVFYPQKEIRIYRNALKGKVVFKPPNPDSLYFNRALCDFNHQGAGDFTVGFCRPPQRFSSDLQQIGTIACFTQQDPNSSPVSLL